MIKAQIVYPLRIMGLQNWWFGDPEPCYAESTTPSFLVGSTIVRALSFCFNILSMMSQGYVYQIK